MYDIKSSYNDLKRGDVFYFKRSDGSDDFFNDYFIFSKIVTHDETGEVAINAFSPIILDCTVIANLDDTEFDIYIVKNDNAIEHGYIALKSAIIQAFTFYNEHLLEIEKTEENTFKFTNASTSEELSDKVSYIQLKSGDVFYNDGWDIDSCVALSTISNDGDATIDRMFMFGIFELSEPHESIMGYSSALGLRTTHTQKMYTGTSNYDENEFVHVIRSREFVEQFYNRLKAGMASYYVFLNRLVMEVESLHEFKRSLLKKD